MSETYEVLAVKYAHHSTRTRIDNFMLPDDHESVQPIDYFVWVIRNSNRTIIVDTGMDRAEAEGRGRSFLQKPLDALALIGIDAHTVDDVIITHLHFDHAGTLDDFPSARFHLQEAEMAFATGACMCDEFVRRTFNVEHVCGMVRRVFSGRVQFYNGDGEVAPGITVHRAGGHTLGLQCVRVATDSGFVVLASDAAHLYENFERRKPFSITIDVAETLRSYTRLEQLATSRAHIVPGHDPFVLKRYPPWKTQTEGRVHRLDVPRLT
jgi:glyoxylase-like metal-dependent hydrolase (beta-lactamase superfamily II)